MPNPVQCRQIFKALTAFDQDTAQHCAVITITVCILTIVKVCLLDPSDCNLAVHSIRALSSGTQRGRRWATRLHGRSTSMKVIIRQGGSHGIGSVAKEAHCTCSWSFAQHQCHPAVPIPCQQPWQGQHITPAAEDSHYRWAACKQDCRGREACSAECTVGSVASVAFWTPVRAVMPARTPDVKSWPIQSCRCSDIAQIMGHDIL